MKLSKPGLYHIYNRGNDKQTIFFTDKNYEYFIAKCHQYLKPVSEIFAWCLMPNHFHFLLEVTEKSQERITCGGIAMPALTNGFRLLLSSYAKGINKQENKTGNLFQQKTKAKLVSDDEGYDLIAFSYIHQNPVEAKLVRNPADWSYSSYNEYSRPTDKKLCNISRAKEVLGLTAINIPVLLKKQIDELNIDGIF